MAVSRTFGATYNEFEGYFVKQVCDIRNVGGIDADADDLLISCFQDNSVYQDIEAFEKYVVLGRKGAGKTSIYRKFLDESRDDLFAIGHTFSDYPWHYHDKQAKIGVPDHDKFTHSWKYLILLTLSKLLLNRDHSIPFDDDSAEYVSRLESFIVDSYGSRDPDVANIFTPTNRLKVKGSLNVDLSILKASIGGESIPIEFLPTIVQDVNANLLKCVIGSLNDANRYYVMFDELDLGFDPESDDYKYRLIGLLLAAKELNRAAREAGKNMSIIVFLRNDIYDSLKFEDKNKLTRSAVSMIEWDSVGGNSLKGLIEKRFTQLLRDKDEDSVSWEDVFDEEELMTGKQTKYNYIKDRTFVRPRDLVQFCNEIVAAHRRNGDRLDKISNKEIYEAKFKYSKYFIDEIDDEVHKHIPHYEKVLEIIKSIGYHQFDMEDFELAIDKKRSLFNEDVNAYEAMKELFRFSLLGYYKPGGSGYGGSEYVFKYKDSGAEFEEGARTYRIHPGLIEHLGLKRATKPK